MDYAYTATATATIRTRGLNQAEEITITEGSDRSQEAAVNVAWNVISVRAAQKAGWFAYIYGEASIEFGVGSPLTNYTLTMKT